VSWVMVSITPFCKAWTFCSD